MAQNKRILVTGAAGKVGQAFIKELLANSKFDNFIVRALCHNRMLEPSQRLEVIQGSIETREVVDQAMTNVSHVLHLATTK